MWKSAAVVLFAAVVLSSLLYGTTLIFGVCSSWNATLEERSEAQRFQTLRCGHCMNLSQAPTVSSISCEQFTELYAKTGRPLIVTDALPTSALKGMSLSEAVSYIKDIYLRSVISGKEDEFFNEFRNVLDGNYDQEHFRKTEDVFVYASIENVTSTAWYFNWRSFNDEFVANRHVLVPTPYCFSSWSYPEMDMLEFFFANPREDRPITSFGRHVDTPESSGTWHAQLAGVKVWELWPPIQCNEVCKPINVTAKAGESFFINTELWEHQCSIPPRSEDNPYSLSIAQDYMLSVWDHYLLTFDFYKQFYHPHRYRYTFPSTKDRPPGHY